MNRMRSLVATAFAVVLFAASTASAATITFTFFTGTGYTADLPTNVNQDNLPIAGTSADQCATSSDYCAPMLRFFKDGVTLEVTASRPGFPNSTQPMYVNEDLGPEWGGLGVDGGTTDNPGGDNNGPGETLHLSFSQPVILKSFIAFRDHQNYYNSDGDPDTTITAVRDGLLMQQFDVPIGTPPGVPALPNLGNALFTFSPTFAGSIFDFSINDETFYISQVTIETENVPEPSTLLLLGMALVGGARAYRRRTAA